MVTSIAVYHFASRALLFILFATVMKNLFHHVTGLIVLLTLFVLASGCRNSSEKKFQPSPLAPGLFSGQSLEAVERELKMMDGSFDIVMDRVPLPSDTRPPYRLLIISRKNQVLAEQKGELEMTFFNDQLMTTRFFAADVPAAQAAFERSQKFTITSGQSDLAPMTRIWVGKDENLRGYIGWTDKKLRLKQDAWVRQYGQ